MDNSPLPPIGAYIDDDVLDSYLEAATETECSVDALSADEQAANAWAVENDEQAEWAARKLATAANTIREKEYLRNWWVSQIEDWFRDETKRAQRTALFFEDRLTEYAVHERIEHGRATIKLPSAEFGTTAGGAHAVVDDDETVAAYLTEAWEKLTSDFGEIVELGEVVKRSAKVYVAPFRKITSVASREHGVVAHLTLSCGHEKYVDVTGLDDEALPAPSSMPPLCDECGDVLRSIESVVVEPIVEQVVVGPDGEPVPGTSVDPGGITPRKITLR